MLPGADLGIDFWVARRGHFDLGGTFGIGHFFTGLLLYFKDTNLLFSGLKTRAPVPSLDTLLLTAVVSSYVAYPPVESASPLLLAVICRCDMSLNGRLK